jgi:hypothetical protein
MHACIRASWTVYDLPANKLRYEVEAKVENHCRSNVSRCGGPAVKIQHKRTIFHNLVAFVVQRGYDGEHVETGRDGPTANLFVDRDRFGSSACR